MTKIRKPLMKSGGSRVIVIPDFWLQSLKREHGTIPERMELELSDEMIIVRPVYDESGQES